MLDKLAQTHGFAHGAEVLFDGIVDGDGRRGVVGAVEIPGEEAGEVLECSEDFVTTDCGESVRLSGLSCVDLAVLNVAYRLSQRSG